jgi:F0F1-type ATP synthase gamma subunit
MASSVKNIVKVMNFHSLIRVDKAKRQAAKDRIVEKELRRTLASLINNVNLKMDDKMLKENPNGDILNIYIGNDYGFCGNFNHQLQAAILSDKQSKKIVIGRKLMHLNDNNIILKISKDDFFTEYGKLSEIVSDYIRKEKVKEINVYLNYYHSVSEITFECMKLFPIELTEEDKRDIDTSIDYVIETDVNGLIASIIALGICYEIKVLESNSYASENVMRERITRESIKKIEELEIEQTRLERKEKNAKAFKKQISNYRIIKG